MKHDREEPKNLGWPADRGAREAKYDGQGALIEKQKRDSVPLTEYERLAQALYDAAREGLGIGREESELFKWLGFPDLAHQIREGIRDAGKVQPSVREAGSVFGGIGISELIGNIPLKGPTTEAEFTEEEIATVKNDARHIPIASLHHIYKRGEALNGSEYNVLGLKWSRLAACAQHLAKMEG